MEEFVLWAWAQRLGFALLAVVGLVSVSAWLDHRARLAWSETIRLICQEPASAALYYGLRFIGLALVVGLLMGCAPAAASVFPDRYDREIRRAVLTWWGDYPDWLSWKSQLYQESRLDPAAVSPVGAAGLAQFMPATWAEVARQLRLPPGASPHHDVAIEAGAWYMARLRRQWSAPRPAEDRQRLAQASYNAGLGHLLAAQRHCRAPTLYAEIVACLPAITGRHAAETITYVARIAKWRAMMAAGL